MDEAVADRSAVEEEGAIPTDRIIAEVTAAGEAPVVEVIGASAGGAVAEIPAVDTAVGQGAGIITEEAAQAGSAVDVAADLAIIGQAIQLLSEQQQRT